MSQTPTAEDRVRKWLDLNHHKYRAGRIIGGGNCSAPFQFDLAKNLYYPPCTILIEATEHGSYDSREGKALEQVRRLRGQIEAVERALEEEKAAYDMLINPLGRDR